MAYIPHTAEDIREMLKAIGQESVESLFQNIPAAVRLREKYKIPQGMSELELWKHMLQLAGKNEDLDRNTSFLGAGVYDHCVPILVDYLTARSEFWTSYTPYQPEASQGSLQAIFEYQTAICELTGMDVSNASMYDGASAMAEAVLLAYFHHHQERKIFLMAPGLHPEYSEVAASYMKNFALQFDKMPEQNGRIDLAKLKEKISDQVAGVVVASPNFYGLIEEMAAISELAHQVGALMIAVVNPISLGLLAPPGSYMADVAVGEGQPLGIPPAWGGLGFGFLAAREEHLRKMPGRIAGQTVDEDGKRGFVLTIQTREQHIRREKATSNICSNQALMALRGLIYMATVGKQGLQEVATQCVQKAHYLANQIKSLPSYTLRYDAPFFHEFVVGCPKPAKEITSKLQKNNIYAGIPMERWFPERSHDLLVSVTECVSKQQMDNLVSQLKTV
jgi:glycine dehydrogenase subunit 1